MALMSTAEIARFVADRLWSAPDSLRGVKKWTAFVKQELRGMIAKSKCYTSSLEGSDREYLTDICLADECDKSHHPAFRHTRLLLAVESEWSAKPSDRSYDFAKLADVRAERKLFIGAISSKELSRRGDIVAGMLAYVNHHRLVPHGEEYAVVLCDYGKVDGVNAWILKRGAKKPRLIAAKA